MILTRLYLCRMIDGKDKTQATARLYEAMEVRGEKIREIEHRLVAKHEPAHAYLESRTSL